MNLEQLQSSPTSYEKAAWRWDSDYGILIEPQNTMRRATEEFHNGTAVKISHGAPSEAQRVMQMAKQQRVSAAEWVPQTGNLTELRKAAPGCRGCALYEHATQVVFGEGPQSAKVVMVGETPGNDEDLAGHPFVGPAGKLLNTAMTEAGIDRTKVYVTNAVKHFKFTERGKRRIHSKPSGGEISACRPWLEAELATIHPDLIVCLGATAAQTLMGRDFRITAERGVFFPHRWAKELVATIHPSAILRAQDRQEQEYQLFVKDMHTIAARIRELELAS